MSSSMKYEAYDSFTKYRYMYSVSVTLFVWNLELDNMTMVNDHLVSSLCLIGYRNK